MLRSVKKKKLYIELIEDFFKIGKEGEAV